MRSVRTRYVALAALLATLSLGVAACGGSGGGGGGGGGSSPSSQPQQQPVAKTGAVGNLDESEAEVSATINPKDQPSTTYYFEYGETEEYGSKTPAKSVSGNTDKTVTADLTDLDAGTTYHYRVVAKTGSGTLVEGRDHVFATPAAGEGGGSGAGGGGESGDNNASTGGGTTGKSTGGYTTTPPKSTGGYTTTPPPSTGGYTTTPPPSTGGYTTTPPPSTGGYTTTPPK